MSIDTHGYKIKGLKHISGETKSLKGFYSPEYLELIYDKSNGETWTEFQCSIGHNSFTRYCDENILTIGNLYEPHTMQELADMIVDEVERRTQNE